jgi:hypothetical protein
MDVLHLVGSAALLAVCGTVLVLALVAAASFAVLAAIRAYVPGDEQDHVTERTRTAIARRDGRSGWDGPTWRFPARTERGGRHV